MQSKTTRGLRRLLVSTGVISLVLSVAAPAALATPPEGVGNPRDRTEHLAGPLSNDGKMWVCHATSTETNPFVGIWVSVNARGHLEHDDLELVQCPLDLPVVPEDDELGVRDGVGGGESGNNGVGDGVGGGESGNNGVGDGVGGGQSGNNGVGEGTGGESGNNGGDEETGGQSGTGEPQESTTPKADEPKPGETIISTVTVTRPAPATPATPTVPATPAAPAAPQAPVAPQAPAAPVTQTVTNTPTAPVPSVAVSATSKGNEVLGSVTTRTPGGAQVTALAATGTSTTVALAALGAVLLLAGFGLQVTARRVQSSAVEA